MGVPSLFANNATWKGDVKGAEDISVIFTGM
jgi:hypothetical protein